MDYGRREYRLTATGVVMVNINGGINSSALRMNTKASQPRTSSNRSFQDQFRSGLRGGIDLGNSAIRQVIRPLPGSAALSASLSQAAASLDGASGLNSNLDVGAANLDGSTNSLQDEMLKNNQEMLEQQMRVSQITTSFSTRSYIVKAMFDALKTIGSNIR